jgi:hypothetical protein
MAQDEMSDLYSGGFGLFPKVSVAAFLSLGESTRGHHIHGMAHFEVFLP